jgi:Large extracellular alpha-helical protein
VVATLRRPLDAKEQRMPGRAIGVQWFSIDRKARTLALDMTLPPLQRPNTTLRVPIKIDGLGSDQARVVVAAVDVGILNLTNYKPPAPDEFYLGQRQLSAELRDLYGQLIDGMQGTRGQIRTGGDAGAELNGSPPSQAPLRSSPASSRSAPDRRRSRSTFRPSPAPSASWRWPGARIRSAALRATSPSAIRWC